MCLSIKEKRNVIFKIKYDYKTGNSFGSSNQEGILEFEWENIETAKECIKRIKEHYEWYQSKESYFKDEKPKPEWHRVEWSDEPTEHKLINLCMDDGQEVQFWPPWCGYFESLYRAYIVVDGKDLGFQI